MIIKNEGNIIYDTLKSLYKKIKFDRWVICDTGSNDNTIDELKRFFIETKYKGQFYKCEWVNFAYNRTEALALSRGKTDYVLIFDADDRIEGDFVVPKYRKGNGYTLNFTDGKNFWKRIALLDNRMEWYFEGVIHEYVKTKSPHNRCHLNGNYAIKTNVVVSHRNKKRFNYNKLIEDAKIMEKAFSTEKNNKLKARYAFYCGKNYSGTKYIDKSIKWYNIRLTFDINKNELWQTSYQLGLLHLNKNKASANEYFMKCLSFNNRRFENIYYILLYNYEKDELYTCLNLLKIIKGQYKLENIYKDFLFKNKEIIYDFLPKLIINIFTHVINFLNKPDSGDPKEKSLKYIEREELVDIIFHLEYVFYTSFIVFLNKNKTYKKDGVKEEWEKLSIKQIHEFIISLKKFILFINTKNKKSNLFFLKNHFIDFIDFNKHNLKKNKKICVEAKNVFNLLPDKTPEDENLYEVRKDIEKKIKNLKEKQINIEEEKKILKIEREKRILKIETKCIGIQTTKQILNKIDDINIKYLDLKFKKTNKQPNVSRNTTLKNKDITNVKSPNKIKCIDKSSQTILSSQNLRKRI